MQKREKIRYEIDPHNKLIYARTGKKSKLPRFRTILDGRFKFDKNNQLTYHVKKSQVYKAPQQVRLRGNWSLDKDHNLVLTLNKWGNQIAGNKLTIKSELIDAKANRLSFAATTKDSQGKTHIYILNLGGRWQADRYNRLEFNIKKEKGLTDKLTLKGTWEVNKQNEIIYTYAKSYLRPKAKITKTVTFKGYWDIAKKYRITYVLNKEIDSLFDFKVGLGKTIKKGLQYEVGIGVTPVRMIITLFGKWKVHKRLGLLFEMPYEKGRLESVIFGAWAKLDKNYNLELRLKNKRGQDLGIDVKLSRRILEGQGEAFIRALKQEKEVSILAGVGFRW